MVNDDALVGSKVSEQTMAATVKVVAGNNLITGSKKSSNDIESSHSRADSQCSLGVHDLGEVSFEMCSGRISGALVDRNAGSAILVFAVGVYKLGGKSVSLATSAWARWRRRRRKVMALVIDSLQRVGRLARLNWRRRRHFG
ncbi:hypothetical protein HG530_000053 [Fusarium avenaceum]|nr:hypothetical protein HG530_000053 [Fusarium avenaceum]